MSNEITWQWRDARQVEYEKFLSWDWSPVDAAFAAFYCKPFSAVLVSEQRGEQGR